MSYMLLVMEPPGQRDTRSLAEGQEVFDRMVRFGESLRAKGILQASNSLGGPAKGARVQVRNGKRSMVDGPFAEAKEIVAGYWIWQVKSMEEAVEWLRRCPDPMPGEESEIELRPVFEAYLAQLEKDYISQALQRTGGNQTRAAKISQHVVRSPRRTLDKHKIRQTARLLRESTAMSGTVVHKQRYAGFTAEIFP